MPRFVEGLAVALALLAVGACGGDDDVGDGRELSADEFCEQAEPLLRQVLEDNAASDESRAARDEMQDIQPPGEIAEAWDTVVSFSDQLAENPDTDADPDSASEFSEAFQDVGRYLQEECPEGGSTS